MRASDLELELEFQLRASGIDDYERELLLVPGRRFRSDFVWPDDRLVVEVEGGTWSRGRHTRGSGFHRDCEKYNALTLLGWRVLRFDSQMVNDGTALGVIETALGREAA